MTATNVGLQLLWFMVVGCLLLVFMLRTVVVCCGGLLFIAVVSGCCLLFNVDIVELLCFTAVGCVVRCCHLVLWL